MYYYYNVPTRPIPVQCARLLFFSPTSSCHRLNSIVQQVQFPIFFAVSSWIFWEALWVRRLESGALQGAPVQSISAVQYGGKIELSPTNTFGLSELNPRPIWVAFELCPFSLFMLSRFCYFMYVYGCIPRRVSIKIKIFGCLE